MAIMSWMGAASWSAKGVGSIPDRVLTKSGSSKCCRSCPSQRLNVRSEEHTSELQSLMRISYAVFCLKKKNLTTAPDYDTPSHRIHLDLGATNPKRTHHE